MLTKVVAMNKIKYLILFLGTFVFIAGAYIVKKGDTLWDLSESFFNDPFFWPDLWESNRHIEDPHWIYPGDSIYIGELDTSTTQASVSKKIDCDGAADSSLPNGVKVAGCDPTDSRNDHFENMLGNLRSKSKVQKKLKKTDEYFYKKRPEAKIFNAYYQTLSPNIYELQELSNDPRWFSIRSGEGKTPLLHLPETEIVVGIGRKLNSNLKKGDLVEVWQAKKIDILDSDAKNSSEHALLQLSGYAKITAVGDSLSRATLVQSFKEINIDKSKAKLKESLNPINVNGYTAISETEIKNMGYVLYAIDPSLVIGSYSYLIVNKGENHGFNTGDGVAIWEEDISDSGIAPRLLGRGIISRSKKEQSTILIRELYSNNRRIKLGHRVSLTHKANIISTQNH